MKRKFEKEGNVQEEPSDKLRKVEEKKVQQVGKKTCEEEMCESSEDVEG